MNKNYLQMLVVILSSSWPYDFVRTSYMFRFYMCLFSTLYYTCSYICWFHKWLWIRSIPYSENMFIYNKACFVCSDKCVSLDMFCMLFILINHFDKRACWYLKFANTVLHLKVYW